MKRSLVLGLGLTLTMVMLFAVVGMAATSLDEGELRVTVTNPLYAEIRGLPSLVHLGALVFTDSYQNRSQRVYFDIITNGTIEVTATITKPFRHINDQSYWLRSLAYFRLADGTSVVPHRLEFNHEFESNWSSSQSGILSGPRHYKQAYLDVEASRWGADIDVLMQGEYESEFVITIAAPTA